MSYSPSTGKMCRTRVPPSVPSGRPSMCWSCDRSCGTRYVSPPGRIARIADCQRADRRRGGEVALLQRRRHAEHVRHVVEAERRVVWRQQQRRINVQVQQIANRVCVLGAVQAMQHRPAGIRRARSHAIELAFEPARKGVEDRRRRTWRTWRRHQTGRSFRVTFSHVSMLAAGVASAAGSSARPPVCSRWLWQVTQDRVRSP